jgi:hypothetical protein
MSSVASALLSFMEAADFMNWTKNKGGWDKIKEGMSNKEVEKCRPAGVTFNKDSEPTKIDLYDSGLKGTCKK